MKPTPSLWRIIQVDYAASISVIFPLVAWGLAVVARFFDPEAAAFFLSAAPIVTVVGLTLLWWRTRLIRQVFTEGEETPGVLITIGFFRGRGRAEYVYTYQSRKYQSGNAIQASAITRALIPSQAVTVMVDRSNPKRAFLRELYL